MGLFRGYEQSKRRCQRGQNLVELALTLPFLLLLIFTIVEVGRAWQTYQGAKMAAIDGAYTASVYHDEALGEDQMQARLNQARIPYNAYDIVPVENTAGSTVVVGYKANVNVTYKPLFGGMSLPTLVGAVTIIPSEFPIEYHEIYYNSIY